MTPDKLKQFLAPETFECEMCKKPYNTTYEARRCGERDEMHRRAELEKAREEEEQRKREAAELQKVLEANL